MNRDLSMEKVLNTQMGENSANAKTVKEYLMFLLLRVWEQKESFNGKRPFGNSGWENEIILALANKENVSEEEELHYSKLVKAAIRYLFL